MKVEYPNIQIKLFLLLDLEVTNDQVNVDPHQDPAHLHQAVQDVGAREDPQSLVRV